MNVQVQKYHPANKGSNIGMLRVVTHLTQDDYAALCSVAHKSKNSISGTIRNILREHVTVQA